MLPEREMNDSKNPNLMNVHHDLFDIEVQPQFSRHLIDDTVWEKAHLNYHMFLLHTRWNHHEISHVMNEQGIENVFYFSILRDPVMLYRSYWDYFSLSTKFDKTLDEYAKTVIIQYVLHDNMTYKPPGYNQMLNDFGMYFHEMVEQDGSKMSAKKNVEKKIEEIDKTFDLILLADEEYYEDGMILLKNELSWEFEDIINVRRNVFPASQHSSLSDETRNTLKGSRIYVKYNHDIKVQ